MTDTGSRTQRRTSPPKRFPSRLAQFLGLLFVFSGSALAEPLVTDRPDQTESSNIVRPGSLQIEGGLTYERETDTEDTHTFTVPQALLRLGVTPNFEFRIGGDGFAYLDREGMDNISNGSDITIGGKMLFFKQSGYVPDFATLFALSVPTGGKQVTSDGVDPSGILIFSWDLPKDFGLGVNVGFAAPTQGEGSDNRVFETTTTVALGIPLTERLGAFVEYFGTVAAEGAQDAHSMDGGFTYLINDDLQLDLSGGGGITDAASDFFIGLGVSWRYRFLGGPRVVRNESTLLKQALF